MIQLTTFVCLSVTDLIQTKLLLQHSRGVVYESNPFANAILQNYGWTALTIFKLTTICVFTAIVIYISYFRPKVAQRLLAFACLLMMGVVSYSTYLFLHYV